MVCVQEVRGPADRALWTAFAAAEPSATFFHQPAWFATIEAVLGAEPLHRLAWRAGRVVGVLGLVKVSDGTRRAARDLLPLSAEQSILTVDDEARQALRTTRTSLVGEPPADDSAKPVCTQHWTADGPSNRARRLHEPTPFCDDPVGDDERLVRALERLYRENPGAYRGAPAAIVSELHRRMPGRLCVAGFGAPNRVRGAAAAVVFRDTATLLAMACAAGQDSQESRVALWHALTHRAHRAGVHAMTSYFGIRPVVSDGPAH